MVTNIKNQRMKMNQEGKTHISITTEMLAWRSFDNYNTTP